MAVRNQHPVQLTTLRMTPTSARTLDAGSLELGLTTSYSSLFLQTEVGTNSYRMDGEILRAGLFTRYSPLNKLQVSIELPAAHTSGGFLDGFLENYHDAFGLNDGKRDEAPRNRFLVSAMQDDQSVYRMERRSVALLDIPIEAMWQFVEYRGVLNLDLALRAALELPTGDQQSGYGNGGIDYAVGALGEISWGPLALSAHIAHTTIATPDRARKAGLVYRDGISSGFGLEAALARDLSLLVQVEMDQCVLRNLRDVHTESDQWLLWVGFRTHISDDLELELSFGEDLTLNAAPDFTVFMGLRGAFGGAR